MTAIKLNGTQQEYIEKGKGEPVILVHGTLGDYRAWQLQMNAFAEKYRTISYSRRYHLPNLCRGDETNYSANLHADDLDAFISALGLESAYVAGTSYGAYTALVLAARHQERVRAMVLGDPPVFPLIAHFSEGRQLRDNFLAKVWRPVGELMQKSEPEKGIKVFVDGVVEKGAFNSFPPEVRNLILDNACEFRAETTSPDFWTNFTCNETRLVETPALLLTGDRSLRMFQLMVSELERCLPNSESIKVPDTTHEVPSDNPDKYNEIVLKFLAKHT